MIVVDASALVAALTVSGDAAAALRRRLGEEDLHVPHLLDVEVVSAVRRLLAAKALDARAGDAAVVRLRRWPLNRHSHVPLLARVHALRRTLTSYDATYVALAEALGVPLVTCDRHLSRSQGHRASVENHAL
ncbi:MAG: type II toxin-antitoxin system VapC family toxin [Acidimicrobiales bacterium]|jgi:predicted nucleic acid-binding protein